MYRVSYYFFKCHFGIGENPYVHYLVLQKNINHPITNKIYRRKKTITVNVDEDLAGIAKL